MKWAPISLPGFLQGLNKEVGAVALQADELSEAMNVRIGNKGEVERRSGYKPWSSGLTYPVHFLHHWASALGAQHTIVVDEEGIAFQAQGSSAFSTLVDLGPAIVGGRIEYPVSFAAGENHLFISSLRMGVVKKWDGIALSDADSVFAPPPPANPGDALDPEYVDEHGDPYVYIKMPVGQHLVYRHGRMYIGRTKKEPSRIWFSHVLDPDRYNTNGWVDLDPEDGTTITAMTSYADELFIFKDNSMWELTGRDPTTYALRTVDKLRGTVSPKTVCQMRGLLVFFDRDTGLWGYDGSTLTLLSEKINTYLLGNQDYDRAVLASAYFGDDRLYVSIPWNDGTLRTFVMNAQTGAWSEYDSGFLVGDYHLQHRYQSFSELEGLYVADPEMDDINGVEYKSEIRTGWIFPLGAGVKARLRRVEMIVDGKVGTDVEIIAYREMDNSKPYTQRTFQIPPAAGPHTVTLDGWGNRFHSMQLQFKLTKRPVTLIGLTAFVSGGEDIRGERR